MCLSTVSSGFVKYRTRVGYKVMVRVNDYQYTGPCFNSHSMIMGYMYTANVSLNEENGRNHYLNGFHIFKKKLDAKRPQLLLTAIV